MTCARCQQPICSHSDAEYAGVIRVPARAVRPPQTTAGVLPQAGRGGSEDLCLAPASKISPVHSVTDTSNGARDHVC